MAFWFALAVLILGVASDVLIVQVALRGTNQRERAEIAAALADSRLVMAPTRWWLRRIAA